MQPCHNEELLLHATNSKHPPMSGALTLHLINLCAINKKWAERGAKAVPNSVEWPQDLNLNKLINLLICHSHSATATQPESESESKRNAQLKPKSKYNNCQAYEAIKSRHTATNAKKK